MAVAEEDDTQRRGDKSRIVRAAWFLGLAGLVPFLVMLPPLLYAGRDFIAFPQLVLGLGGYAAVILSFLGGIRWGAALWLRRQGGRVLVLSVLPSIAGWLLLFVPVPYAFAGFALAFAAQGAWDVRGVGRGLLPTWFRNLRIVLTVVVTLVMALAFYATM